MELQRTTLSERRVSDFFLFEAANPPTVCCPTALLVCGLLSVGVPEHPDFRLSITEEEVVGEPQTRWRWVLATQSADGFYLTSDLVKWWHDPAWLAAHPTHEWAIVRATLHNMAEVARRIRDTIPRIIVRRGLNAAHIPANASPARRAHLLGKLEGTIPLNAVFTEPVAA